MIAVERLYLTAMGEVVRAGDPAAAFLLAGVGCDIPVDHVDAVEALAEVDHVDAVEALAEVDHVDAVEATKPPKAIKT